MRGFWTDNPVLIREWRGRLRWKRKGAGRVAQWVAWPLGLVFAYFYLRGLIGIIRAPVQDARDFWPLLTYGILALIVLLAPALAATAITQEREQQTWETLATTQLSASEVLLGKWLGRQLIPWLILAFAAPYLLVCVVRGNQWFQGSLGIWILPIALLFFLVTTGFYSALGLLCSFFTKRTAGATAISLTLTALLCFGTVIIDGVVTMLNPSLAWRNNFSIMWFNPFFALEALQTWPGQGGSGWTNLSSNEPVELIFIFYLLASVFLTAAMLRFMVLRYQRAVQE